MSKATPNKTDGVSFISVKKSQLRDYLDNLRNHFNFVPKEPVTNDTNYVMIVDNTSRSDQYLIQVVYEEEE